MDLNANHHPNTNCIKAKFCSTLFFNCGVEVPLNTSFDLKQNCKNK